MESPNTLPGRRSFLGRSIVGVAALVGTEFFTKPGLFAQELVTPTMTEGPFYPDRLPLDTDNDLLVLNNSITPAVGEISLNRQGNRSQRKPSSQRSRRNLASRQ